MRMVSPRQDDENRLYEAISPDSAVAELNNPQSYGTIHPMSNTHRVGVFVDSTNISMNGGKGMRYEVLRRFAERGGNECVRLNAYVAYDAERARNDPAFRQGSQNFHAILRDFGYKVIEKHVKWYIDDTGSRYGKANVDLDLAVDMLMQGQNLDRIVLVTGDGDFVRVVRALQNQGSRVEVIAFENVSGDLRREADLFLSGHLIPNLLPIDNGRNGTRWGELSSRVRGVCYHHGPGFGFLRFLKQLSPMLWKTDTREPDSPYGSAFFHDSQLPSTVSYDELPSRELIFEFTVRQSQEEQDKLVAEDLELIAPKREPRE